MQSLSQVPECHTLRLILGDELNPNHSWFSNTDSGVLYVIAELHEEGHYVTHHIQKLCAFFAAMADFAASLRRAGHRVLHLTLDDTAALRDSHKSTDAAPKRSGSTVALLLELIERSGACRFECQRPDEFRLRGTLCELETRLSAGAARSLVNFAMVDSEHFLLPFDEISTQFTKGRHVLMESFYRRMRRRFNILMDGDKPMGGQWNFDADNRNKLKSADLASVPEPLVFANNIGEVLSRIHRHNLPYIGRLAPIETAAAAQHQGQGQRQELSQGQGQRQGQGQGQRQGQGYTADLFEESGAGIEAGMARGFDSGINAGTETVTETVTETGPETVTDAAAVSHTPVLLWPINREQSLRLLGWFCRYGLLRFGRFQDAMTGAHPAGWSLYHSRLSFALNCKMLSPLEVIEAAIAAWQANPAIDMAQIEGFVRQILGWREYVRGIYWANMPEFARLNYLEASRPLPGYFWTGNTGMNCMRHAIGQSLDYAYAHHIQRLMITGNFCLLSGINPDEVDAWYLGIYVDAIEWVELPNTRGMALFADGGIIATKPYGASGAYINRMSDYCSGCKYEVGKRSGEGSCPFNSLYWHFLHRNAERFGNNHRLGMIFSSWYKMDEPQRAAILATAEQYLSNLESL